jgi:hypothetical protein
LLTIYVGLSEKYELFTDETDTFSMTTVDFENVFFMIWSIGIDFGEKVSENRLFP